MKVKFLYVVFTMMLLVAPTVMAQSVYDYEYNSQKKNASITFRNSSDYTMTLKIIHSESYTQQYPCLHIHQELSVLVKVAHSS